MTLKDVLTLTESSQKIMLVIDFEEVTTTAKDLANKEVLLYAKVDAIETTTEGGTTYLVIGLK